MRFKGLKGCNIWGQSKSKIFAASFLSILHYQPLCSICIVIVGLKNLKGLIFVDDMLPTKIAKIMSPKILHLHDI